MVGVRQCNSARESSVYADCNVDTNSNPAGYGFGYSNGNTSGDCNFDTDLNPAGYGYDHSHGNGNRSFGTGFDATGYADGNVYARARRIGTGGSGTDS